MEQLYRLFSPNIKAIRVLHRGAVRGRPYKKAKLYFTREVGTRNTLGGVESVVRKARQAEAQAKADRELMLAKKGKSIPVSDTKPKPKKKK